MRISVQDFVQAAQGGKYAVVVSAVEQGLDVNSSCTIKASNGLLIKGSTALHEAAANGHLQIMDYLLEKGSNINQKTNEGWVPLHAATWNKQSDSARNLVKKGADIYLGDNSGYTPIDGARHVGLSPLADELIKLFNERAKNAGNSQAGNPQGMWPLPSSEGQKGGESNTNAPRNN